MGPWAVGRGPLLGGAVFSDIHLSQAIKKEALIQPCFSWKPQPLASPWPVTCTQEAGLYKILQVDSAGAGRCAHHSSPCSQSLRLGKPGPAGGRVGHAALQGPGLPSSSACKSTKVPTGKLGATE